MGSLQLDHTANASRGSHRDRHTVRHGSPQQRRIRPRSAILDALDRPNILIDWWVPGPTRRLFQLGEIYPTSCEASWAVEGPRGLPCCLMNIREWTASFVTGDTDYVPNDVKPCWIMMSKYTSMILVATVLPLVLMVYWKRRQKKKQAEKCFGSTKAWGF